MSKVTRYVGMDVHAETIAVAVVEGRGVARSLGTILNRPEAVRQLVRKLGNVENIRVCYEAGPTGYVLYWQLTKLGVWCEVVAPSLVPTKPGERVKTDRRDALKLARLYRAGELTAVWVPDAAHEALRDLVRAREAAKKDELRARHRLTKYLLRNGRRPAEKCGAWSQAWWQWVRKLEMEHAGQRVTLLDYIMAVEHEEQRVAALERAIDEAVAEAPAHMRHVIEALQALRGVARLTAVTLVTEVGTFRRFERPTQVMSYTGVVPSEHSSGPRDRRGAITKAGNSHLRRVLVEAAWHHRHQPRLSKRQKQIHMKLSPEVTAIASTAQQRLYRKFWRMTSKGKPAGKVATAVARELVGFIWAIGVQAEKEAQTNKAV